MVAPFPFLAQAPHCFPQAHSQRSFQPLLSSPSSGNPAVLPSANLREQ